MVKAFPRTPRRPITTGPGGPRGDDRRWPKEGAEAERRLGKRASTRPAGRRVFACVPASSRSATAASAAAPSAATWCGHMESPAAVPWVRRRSAGGRGAGRPGGPGERQARGSVTIQENVNSNLGGPSPPDRSERTTIRTVSSRVPPAWVMLTAGEVYASAAPRSAAPAPPAALTPGTTSTSCRPACSRHRLRRGAADGPARVSANLPRRGVVRVWTAGRRSAVCGGRRIALSRRPATCAARRAFVFASGSTDCRSARPTSRCRRRRGPRAASRGVSIA